MVNDNKWAELDWLCDVIRCYIVLIESIEIRTNFYDYQQC